MGDAITNTTANLKSAYRLVKDMADLDEARADKAKLAELVDQILSAREGTMRSQEREAELIKQVSGLQQQIDQMKAWDSEKSRYQLQAVDSGAFAYVLKPDKQGDDAPHWLCANCFEKHKKGFLQFKRRMSIRPNQHRSDHSLWVCGSCTAELTVRNDCVPGGNAEPQPEEPVNYAVAEM